MPPRKRAAKSGGAGEGPAKKKPARRGAAAVPADEAEAKPAAKPAARARKRAAAGEAPAPTPAPTPAPAKRARKPAAAPDMVFDDAAAQRARKPTAPAAFDEATATKAAKRMIVRELRAALGALGADAKGLKPALIERLVATQRAASGVATADAPAEDAPAENAPAPAPSRKRKSPPVLIKCKAQQPAKLTRAAHAELAGALSPDVGGRRGAPFEADAPPAPPAPVVQSDPDAYRVDVDPRPPANRAPAAAPVVPPPAPVAAPAPAPPTAAAAARVPAPSPAGVRAWDPATDASAPSFGLAEAPPPARAADVSPFSPWFLCGGPPPLAKQHGPAPAASSARPGAADVLRRVRDEAREAGRLGDVLRGALETRS